MPKSSLWFVIFDTRSDTAFKPQWRNLADEAELINGKSRGESCRWGGRDHGALPCGVEGGGFRARHGEAGDRGRGRLDGAHSLLRADFWGVVQPFQEPRPGPLLRSPG